MDNKSNDPKQALLEKLEQSNNILVTVSNDPSVDELAACLGLTLWLNKAGKHGTAVFSGEVPSTLEFLQPAETLEKNTDSLRDFIIALDKSKADKLRYKVEDRVVKIFITPYRTSLTADDLEYSQGDFNVDMVVALGVTSQEDLDRAITAHGRILHDAAVATITTNETSELGSINWHDAQSSSLSELVVELGNSMSKEHLDGQIATALLTGVVAETNRFSNDKTTPQTMSVSAELMAAGANQQLVASKLEEPKPEPQPEPTNDEPTDDASEPTEAPKPNDGTLEIEHNPDDQPADSAASDTTDEQLDQPAEDSQQFDEPSENDDEPIEAALPNIEDVKPTGDNDEPSNDSPAEPELELPTPDAGRSSKLITEPPSMGGTLTANSRPDDIMLEPASDPLTLASTAQPKPLLDRSSNDNVAPSNREEPAFMPPQPAPPDWMPAQPWLDNQPPAVGPTADMPLPSVPTSDALPTVEPNETLSEIEQAVHSSHLEDPSLNSARDEVMRAINSVPSDNPEPIQALNAQPIDLNADDNPSMPTPSAEPIDPSFAGPVEQPFTMPLPTTMTPPPANPVPPTSAPNNPAAPPPVPPPLPMP